MDSGYGIEYPLLMFIELLKKSYKHCLKIRTSMIIGAVVFGAALFVLQEGTANVIDRQISEYMMTLGIDPGRFEDLNDRMEAGDEEAFEEMLGEMQRFTEELGAMNPEQQTAYFADQGKHIMVKLLPLQLLLLATTILISIIASAYYLVVGTRKDDDPIDSFKGAFNYILPMIGLVIWVNLRSFVWIPFVGLFTGLYYMPRFAFSGVILVRDKKGILESANLSMEAAKGHWLRIVLYSIGLLIVMVLVSLIAALLADFVGPFALFLMNIIGQLELIFAVVFIVFLYDQVLKEKKAK